MSIGFVDFSRGIKTDATISKEASDIGELYSKMMSIIANLPRSIYEMNRKRKENKADTVFCGHGCNFISVL